jgi:multicomponent K+:H+ antiporter subunit D
MMASHGLARLAGYSVIASSGTLVAAVGFDTPALSGGALFYLASSTLAGCALFLLVELLERGRQVDRGPADIDDGRQALPAFHDRIPPRDANLDDDEQVLIGRALPAGLAFLGVTFTVCAMVVSGLPPLSGFVAKLAMLQPLLHIGSLEAWTLFALLIGSGFVAATALLRIGMRHFWTASDVPPPRLRVAETVPVAGLLAALLALVTMAEPALVYTRDAAEALHDPQRYIEAVLGAQPLSGVKGGR